jgi:hypothetical protein
MWGALLIAFHGSLTDSILSFPYFLSYCRNFEGVFLILVLLKLWEFIALTQVVVELLASASRS